MLIIEHIFLALSLTWNRREVHMLYLAKEEGKIWTCSCWEKVNFIMINEFRCGQTWKIWPSPLGLSLYSTFDKNLKRNFYKLYIFSNAAKCLTSNTCNVYTKALRTRLLRKYDKFYRGTVYFFITHCIGEHSR